MACIHVYTFDKKGAPQSLGWVDTDQGVQDIVDENPGIEIYAHNTLGADLGEPGIQFLQAAAPPPTENGRTGIEEARQRIEEQRMRAEERAAKAATQPEPLQPVPQPEASQPVPQLEPLQPVPQPAQG